MTQLLTLCMVCKDDQVLLGYKKRGFGAGRWNGFGGKLIEGETLEAAAKRELYEEVGIIPEEMPKLGIISFSFDGDSKKLEVHIFRIDAFSGEPTESEEMDPKWFTASEIPFTQMWSDDEYWFPYLLANKKFTASFHFDKPSTAEYSSKILNMQINEVDTLP